MASINFSGLSTGMDTRAIIDQMVAAEKTPATLIAHRKSDHQRRLSIVGELVSKLEALREQAAKLGGAGDARAFAATSSDRGRVGVSVTGQPGPGAHRLRVNQLAQAQTTISSGFAAPDGAVTRPGRVDISVGGGAAVRISFGSSDSLYDIANRISSDVDGVHASVVDDGSEYRIVVTGDETGADQAISFAESGFSLGFRANGAALVSAQDAEIVFDGLTVSRPSNTIADLASGLTLELAGVSGAADADTVIRVDTDVAGTREKLQAFVDSYNEVASLLDHQLSHSGEQRGQETLFGDSTLRSLRTSLGRILTSAFPHGADSTSAGAIGLQLSAEGTLSMDSAKLDAALANDSGALDDLFAGQDGAGLAAQLQDLVDGYTRAGDGILVAKQAGLNQRIGNFDKQIERIESRAASLGERLLRQFTALEKISSELQGQLTYLLRL